MKLQGAAAKIYINADGLSATSCLKLELLDEQLRSVPGYSREESALVKKSGLRQPIRWRGKQNLKKFDHPIRIRVSYVGLRPEDARVYAVYLTEK